MASRYHWLVDSTQGTTISNAVIPGRSVVVPAGGRLIRVVTYVKADGIQSATTGVNSVGACQWDQTITMDSTTYGLGRLLWQRSTIMPNVATGLYDAQTFQRVYTLFHRGGSEALGVNFKCSYGGPGKSSLTVKAGQITTIPAGTANFNVRWDITLRALYYL